ncbi:class I SAM-dependent methyltransferase [Falsiroseomonas oryzae]|uniref:class I SAM-dependent methyltransferase n=1 Tax=Falsiroseomonas oryzae TaxID=2766473 RepID=UPI0022EB5B62|nr:class I SAM-dependent methyltransferase [Roseomonas sp. MO-31]
MAEASGGKVQDHYASAGIAARVLAALRAAQGEAAAVTPDSLAPLDHFHGRGLKATQEMAALLAPRPGERILDIGGGIGGPARWVAARFGCHVTCLDLTPEFCRAAEELNAATGLSDDVRVVEGSATELPFADCGFDRAYSENVGMNIADKPRFYAEALRVLRPGGVFYTAYYGAGPRGEPDYPLPWAAGAATSFLTAPEDTREQVVAAGFELVVFRDRTEEVLPDLRENRRRLETQGLPPLGLQTLMGERIRELQINVARSAEEGRLTFIEALARRPA